MADLRRALGPVKITRIEAAPLFGESPKGGWSAEIRPEDSIHAIIAVHTDAGITGYGSVFTDGRLVQAGLKVLEPLYRDENALEPERLSEKLHQNTFWMGRGGTLTHTISGIDIALLGHSRQGDWPVRGPAARRQLPTQGAALLLPADGGARRNARASSATYRAQGFRAFKIGWGPFGRAKDHGLDEAIVAAARDAAGKDAQLFVDAGASDAYWPHGLKWALRTAEMLARL